MRKGKKFNKVKGLSIGAILGIATIMNIFLQSTSMAFTNITNPIEYSPISGARSFIYFLNFTDNQIVFRYSGKGLNKKMVNFGAGQVVDGVLKEKDTLLYDKETNKTLKKLFWNQIDIEEYLVETVERDGFKHYAFPISNTMENTGGEIFYIVKFDDGSTWMDVADFRFCVDLFIKYGRHYERTESGSVQGCEGVPLSLRPVNFVNFAISSTSGSIVWKGPKNNGKITGNQEESKNKNENGNESGDGQNKEKDQKDNKSNNQDEKNDEKQNGNKQNDEKSKDEKQEGNNTKNENIKQNLETKIIKADTEKKIDNKIAGTIFETGEEKESTNPNSDNKQDNDDAENNETDNESENEVETETELEVPKLGEAQKRESVFTKWWIYLPIGLISGGILIWFLLLIKRKVAERRENQTE